MYNVNLHICKKHTTDILNTKHVIFKMYYVMYKDKNSISEFFFRIICSKLRITSDIHRNVLFMLGVPI